MLKAENYLQSPQKRSMDFLGASCVALALGVPAVVAGATTKAVDKKPAIFRNARLGQNWNQFGLLKLTTMQSDAHLHEKEWQDDKTDPRITKLGRIIRRIDLNEVPQVINIVRGDMHFVAARAVNEHVLTRLQDADPYIFDEWYSLYPQNKPGLLGPGQLAERQWVRQGNLLEASRARMLEDIRYWTQTASFVVDLKIAASAPRELISHLLHQVNHFSNSTLNEAPIPEQEVA